MSKPLTLKLRVWFPEDTSDFLDFFKAHDEEMHSVTLKCEIKLDDDFLVFNDDEHSIGFDADYDDFLQIFTTLQKQREQERK